MSDEKNELAEITKFDKCEVLEDEYIVEKILDKRKINGSWKYKVKWEGYSEEECTWEPKENLKNVRYLIEEFESKNKDKEKAKTEKPNLLKKKTNRNNSSFKDDEKSNSVTSTEKRGANGASFGQKNSSGN